MFVETDWVPKRMRDRCLLLLLLAAAIWLALYSPQLLMAVAIGLALFSQCAPKWKVPKGRVWVIEKQGKHVAALPPGWHIRLPRQILREELPTAEVSLRTTIEAFTNDKKKLTIQATVRCRLATDDEAKKSKEEPWEESKGASDDEPAEEPTWWQRRPYEKTAVRASYSSESPFEHSIQDRVATAVFRLVSSYEMASLVGQDAMLEKLEEEAEEPIGKASRSYGMKLVSIELALTELAAADEEQVYEARTKGILAGVRSEFKENRARWAKPATEQADTSESG